MSVLSVTNPFREFLTLSNSCLLAVQYTQCVFPGMYDREINRHSQNGALDIHNIRLIRPYHVSVGLTRALFSRIKVTNIKVQWQPYLTQLLFVWLDEYPVLFWSRDRLF